MTRNEKSSWHTKKKSRIKSSILIRELNYRRLLFPYQVSNQLTHRLHLYIELMSAIIEFSAIPFRMPLCKAAAEYVIGFFHFWQGVQLVLVMLSTNGRKWYPQAKKISGKSR